jgi:tartrate dehydrogenase/decarboxylase/D-malate dehydrogenase
MMLDHLGETSASQDIETVLSRVLNEGNFKTRDMGGKHSTSEMGDAVRDAILGA